MNKVWKKGMAVALAAVMCAGALSGCGRKSEAISAFTFNGKKVDGDFVNFVLRFEQASLDDIYAYYASMMQQDIWSMDDGQGLGVTTWDNFKSNIGTDIEKLLLAEEHAADFDAALTEEEKKAISDAAAKFLADNDKDALASMSATQETVERYLTLSTIKSKVEAGMCVDVDTNVSDEETAQRTVEYIRYTPSTESQTEAQSESEMAGTEAEAPNTVETEAETAVAMTEGETSVVETEPAKKTKASGAAKEETERAQAVTEAEQTVTEAQQAVTEAQSETEDPAMAEAKVKYRAMAEEKLEEIKSGETDFETAAAAVTEEAIPGVTNSSYTFGKDDTYPDAAIIEATNDLEDDTLVEELVEVDDSWYILYVKDAFDEGATEKKKEEIVEERKTEKINEVYDEWMKDAKFEADSAKLAEILKDRSYTAPKSNETEAETQQGGTLGDASVETELHLEVTYETDMVVETESET